MKLLDLIHVNADDIKNLNEYESSELLNKLFRYEFANNSLEISGLTLSSNPKIKDHFYIPPEPHRWTRFHATAHFCQDSQEEHNDTD
jgi:hypothetical protein